MSDATIPATIEAIGITPLVMANGAMAAADNEFSIQFAEIVSKGSKMTREDRHNKDLLQWRGHVYESGGRPVIPANNLNRCLQNAGKAFRLGPSVQRGVLITDSEIPLDYKGPPDVRDLINDEAFWWRTVANLNPTRGLKGGKGTKVWPQFTKWGFTAHITVIADAIDWEDLLRVVEMAGSGEGICDARRLGKGRFAATVTRA